MQTQISRQMNAVVLFIIAIPVIEIYLMIKVGGIIGAFNTILLIFFTAITGVYFARMAGLSTLRSGFNQLLKKKNIIYYMENWFKNTSTRIRLARAGSNNRSFFRIVVSDKRSPRDGNFIEKLGTYNPLLPKEDQNRVLFDEERFKYWLSKGATPS